MVMRRGRGRRQTRQRSRECRPDRQRSVTDTIRLAPTRVSLGRSRILQDATTKAKEDEQAGVGGVATREVEGMEVVVVGREAVKTLASTHPPLPLPLHPPLPRCLR